MNNKIVSLRSFFLIILLSFALQSCITPRDRSIKEWERYEMKTQEEEEIKQQNGVASFHKIKIPIHKEMSIIGCINLSSDTYILH